MLRERFQTPQCVLLLKVVKEVNSCLLVYWKIAGIPDKTQFYAIFMEVFSPFYPKVSSLLLSYWFDTSNDFLTYWRPFLPENWAVNWRIPWIISRRHLWLTRYFQDDFYYNFWLCLYSILNPWWITFKKAFHDQLIRKVCDSTNDFPNSWQNQWHNFNFRKCQRSWGAGSTSSRTLNWIFHVRKEFVSSWILFGFSWLQSKKVDAQFGAIFEHSSEALKR